MARRVSRADLIESGQNDQGLRRQPLASLICIRSAVQYRSLCKQALPSASQERSFRPDAIALIYKTINSDQFYKVGHLIMTIHELPTAEEAC